MPAAPAAPTTAAEGAASAETTADAADGASSAASTWTPPVCPGCGGEWSAEPAAGPDRGPVCTRCGLERGDACRLLFGAANDAYTAARAAAIAGRFREARRLLGAGPAVPSAAVERLDSLCAAALGDAAAPGPDGDPSAVDPRADYAAAHAAALAGDWAPAETLARQVVEAAPELMAAQRLLMLVLAASGQAEAAEKRRQEVLRLFPEEPDTARWRFAAAGGDDAPSPRAARAPEYRRRRRIAPAQQPPERRVSRQPARPFWRGAGAVLIPSALSTAALAVATAALLRTGAAPPSPSPAAAPSPPAAAPSAAAEPSPAARAGTSARPLSFNVDKVQWPLAPELARQAAARHSDADLALAREWFNEALREKKAGDWETADRLAAGVYALASDSYLGDEALLLRAQCAENTGGPPLEAARRWAEIAALKPRSDYAAVGLRHAAALARQAGRRDVAAGYEAALSQYRESGAARR